MAHRLRLNLPLILIVGAMIVGSPRYVGLFANQEGVRLTSAFFIATVYLSGIGMAILEGFAVWYMWSCWSSRQDDTSERKILMVLIALTFIDLALMVTPYIFAASKVSTVSNVLPDAWLWVWSLATAIAPAIVMAATGLAERVARAQPVESTQIAAPKVVDAEPAQDVDFNVLLLSNPDASNAWLASQLGVSRQAIAQRRKKLAIANGSNS